MNKLPEIKQFLCMPVPTLQNGSGEGLEPTQERFDLTFSPILHIKMLRKKTTQTTSNKGMKTSF